MYPYPRWGGTCLALSALRELLGTRGFWRRILYAMSVSVSGFAKRAVPRGSLETAYLHNSLCEFFMKCGDIYKLFAASSAVRLDT